MGHGIQCGVWRQASQFTCFNGAVPLGHGIRDADSGRRLPGGASMGPCLWGTEYGRCCPIWMDSGQLQWGRAFGARNTRGRGPGRLPVRRFNGAVPLGHGIPSCVHLNSVPLTGFNGAVPLGHGIQCDQSRSAFFVTASMGPCLWGTEYDRLRLPHKRRNQASMGPCLWGTEYGQKQVSGSGKTPLQWGRAFGARNTADQALRDIGPTEASMGPCLWGTEYLSTPANCRWG